MLQINNLEKSYGGQTIFDNVSFIVNPGERVGLVGRNGHGKTTLFNMILGEEHQDSGNISIPDLYRIGHLSQHISFTQDSVLKEACLSLPHSEDGRDESYKAESILMGLGFSTEDFTINPDDLSGGYQVRLNLAKVLVSDPNLLLLDEPTNYLDIVSLRWLARFLRSWQKELIIITHDRNFMDSVTTHTMAIHRCGIRKAEGSTEKIYQQLLMEEEIHEKTRLNDEKKRNEAEQFINRFRAKATKAKAVQSRIKALQKHERLEKLSNAQNLEFSFNSAPFTGRQLMEIRDLSFSFNEDGPNLIEELSLFISKGDRIAIIGRNGKGKSTLLNLMAEELSPVSGSLYHHRDLKFDYFGQTNINRLDNSKTIEEEIMSTDGECNRRTARGICGAMMFPGDNAMKKINVLSGGEKSRVLLGKLLVKPANMLLLDEPTNHLDMESTESLLEAIDAFEGAVIIVTHSEMILRALATRLIVFDGGKVSLFEGTYDDFLSRIGWRDESEASTGNDRELEKPSPSINKKELKRLKAELINDKSRTLRELQESIDRTESEIMALEEQTEHDNKALLEASVSGNGIEIKELSKSIHEAKSKVDTLFSDLEKLHNKMDSKAKEFEEKLNTIEA